MLLFLTKILSPLLTQEYICVSHTVLLQGSGAQIALVAMSNVSSLTRKNRSTIPCEGGRSWQSGKPDWPRKYRATVKKQVSDGARWLGSNRKSSGLGVRRTALLLISLVKSLFLSETNERVKLDGLEYILHLQHSELSGQ